MLVFSRQVKKCTILHRHRHSLYSMFYTLLYVEQRGLQYERALIETNLLGEHNLISATINQISYVIGILFRKVKNIF